MAEIIVAFPNRDNAIMIKNLLVKNGYSVLSVCTSGAQTLNACDELDSAVIITGYKLPDMMYYHLKEHLDDRFEMLLVASLDRIAQCNMYGVMAIPFPIKKREFLNTVDVLLANIAEKRRIRRERIKTGGRSKEEMETINQAKQYLISVNNLTEEEAHRYMQKTSMDSGNSMVETAKMILTIMYNRE